MLKLIERGRERLSRIMKNNKKRAKIVAEKLKKLNSVPKESKGAIRKQKTMMQGMRRVMREANAAEAEKLDLAIEQDIEQRRILKEVETS